MGAESVGVMIKEAFRCVIIGNPDTLKHFRLQPEALKSNKPFSDKASPGSIRMTNNQSHHIIPTGRWKCFIGETRFSTGTPNQSVWEQRPKNYRSMSVLLLSQKYVIIHEGSAVMGCHTYDHCVDEVRRDMASTISLKSWTLHCG